MVCVEQDGCCYENTIMGMEKGGNTEDGGVQMDVM